ncbi:hypothetical protein EKI60_06555 [Candidatus Saccharibacteria bacterium]|nr:MAG: hypothetical protein EKI60_06555 [Candidatus Saccharibacteria bacterium]
MNNHSELLCVKSVNDELKRNIVRHDYLRKHGRIGECPRLEDFKGRLVIEYSIALEEFHKKLDVEMEIENER